MKRVISLFICVLMCFSFFTVTVGQVYAAGNATQIFNVTTDGFANEEITFNIVLSSGQKNLTGAILEVAFDDTALEVVEAGAAGALNADGDFVENVPGLYAAELKHNDSGVLAFGYTHATGYTSSSAKNMFYVTFKAISSERRPTSVEFACVELITADGDDSNNIAISDGIQTIITKEFNTLSQPMVKEVNSVDNGLSVIWSKSIGAESYTLYRKTAGTEWVALDAVIGGDVTEYVDNTIEQGTEYFYTVSASNSYTETAYAETGVAGMNFGSISSIEATPVATGAKITWSALAGAEKYELLRKLSSSDNWQKVVTTASCEYVDESISSGVYYDYRVRAIQGNYSAGMAVAPVTVKFISTPVIYVQNVNGGIDVSFDEVGGAAKYVIEKSANGGAFEVAGEVEDASGYLDENVVANGSYSYRVQAVAEDGLASAKATSAAIVRLGIPSNVLVSNTSNGVKLTWSEVAGADEYEVFLKVGESSWVSVAVLTATSYTDTSVESGKSYLYAVSAKNETGDSGFDSGAYIYYIAEPEIVSVSNIASGIRVVWNQVEGAEKYLVYRAPVASDNWEQICEVADDSYVDAQAEHGVYYKYTVVAVSGDVKSTYNKNGVEGMYFGTITQISAVANENGATITWGALEKATSYKVYRKTADDENWTEVAEVTGNTYKDNGIASGVRYYYMVKAYSGNNVAETTADAAVVKYIAAPDSIVKNVGTGIKITVTPVGGADTYKIYKDGKLIATLTGGKKEYIDTDVVAYGEYRYTVYAASGDISSIGKETATIVRLGAPKDITLTNIIPGIKVTWTPVDDAVLYEVYRKEGAQKNWEKIAEMSETSYIDGTVFGDEYYSYAISAVTADGGNSGYDEIGVQGYFLETPDLESVTNVSGGVQFTWNAVDGATSYVVYRKTSDTTWTGIAEVEDTSFVDNEITAGKEYTYTVRAKRGIYQSYFDSGLSIVCISKPATPKLGKVSNTASGVKVTWSASKNASKYIVYRKTYDAKTKKWSGWKNIAGNVTTTSYVDKSAKSGTYYLYTVKATNAAGNSGYNTSGIKTYFLSMPKVTTANSNAGVTVKWTKAAGATGYIVYRKTTGEWTRVATVKGSSKVSYTDKTAKAGTTYRYTVKAYYSSYNSAYNTNGVAVRRLTTPTLKSASSAKAGITVKWNKVTGATGYIVYRKTGNGGWQKVATVKSNTYLDKSAKKGVTYQYTVKAYYGTSTSYYNTKGIACKDRY